MTIKPKKTGFGLEMSSFIGKKTKNSYIMFKSLGGSYHAFMEVEAKDAIIDCLGGGERKRPPVNWVTFSGRKPSPPTAWREVPRQPGNVSPARSPEARKCPRQRTTIAQCHQGVRREARKRAPLMGGPIRAARTDDEAAHQGALALHLDARHWRAGAQSLLRRQDGLHVQAAPVKFAAAVSGLGELQELARHHAIGGALGNAKPAYQKAAGHCRSAARRVRKFTVSKMYPAPVT